MRGSNPGITACIYFRMPLNGSNLTDGLGPFFQIESSRADRVDDEVETICLQGCLFILHMGILLYFHEL